MYYILLFIISLICLYLSGKVKNKYIKLLLETVAILLPCFMAGFRDNSIGTDTPAYVTRLFNTAVKTDKNFIYYYQHPGGIVSEVLYLFVTYLCSRITSNIFLLFFVNQLLVIVPLYFALKKINRNNKNSVLLGMFIYFMFFYNMSLNIARQSIAIAFSILAFSYIDDAKKIKVVMYSIIAMLFHRTAIVLIPVFILYYIIKTKRIKESHKKVLEVSLILITLFTVLSLKGVLSLLVDIGIGSEYFSRILNKYTRASINFNEFNNLFYLLLVGVIFYNRSWLKEKMKNFSFFSFLGILSISIMQLGGIIQFADRIGYYTLFITLFNFIPKLALLDISKAKSEMGINDIYNIKEWINFARCKIKNIKLIKKVEDITIIKNLKHPQNLNDKDKIYSLIFTSSIFVVYWTFWILIQNVHETNPYMLMS